MHAPWIRTIYIVTASQVPVWLNTAHPRVRIIDHKELFPDPAAQLPTFNSLAIESVLHRIPGLSEYFLYFNNDGSCFVFLKTKLLSSYHFSVVLHNLCILCVP